MAKKLKLVTLADGRRVSVREAAKETGLKIATIYARLRRGLRGNDVTDTDLRKALCRGYGDDSPAWRHGMIGTPTYIAWSNAVQKSRSGIELCERWKDFRLFFEDMGYKPDELCLRMKDESVGLTPENCYWGKFERQGVTGGPGPVAALLEHDGQSLTIKEWSKKLGIPRPTIYKRIYRGEPTKWVLSTKRRRGGQRT